MVVAEFVLIAFVVGIVTKTWLGFVGTFLALYAIYRFTRLSALLSLALSLYWGLLGYHLGAATGHFVAAPLLAVVAFLIALGIHRDGFSAPALQRGAPAGPLTDDRGYVDSSTLEADRPARRVQQGEVIDAEYRVVS